MDPDPYWPQSGSSGSGSGSVKNEYGSETLVFTDVLTVGRLDVDGQSFAPIGLHKIDAASD